MTAAPAAGNDPLVAFLGYLARHGFQVGARELMRANELMLALLGQGRLPERLSDRMALLQPLLCRSAQQQADFQRLLRQWVPEAGQPGAGWRRRRRQAAADASGLDTRRRWPAPWMWGLAVLLLAVGLGVAVGWRQYCEPLGWCKRPAPPVLAPTAQPEVPGPRGSEPATTEPVAPPSADPPGHLPLVWAQRDPGRVDVWLDLAGGAALLILGSMAGLMLLRRLALQPLRTDAWLDQRHLFAPRMRLLPRVPALLRQVTRELRRPRRTDRQELDLAQTIAATVRRGGAFEPRYRPRSGTPEYLVLIDRHGPNDQLAQVAEDLVGVLHRQGVALQAWRFNRDPSVCQPLRLDGRGNSRTRLRFAELALRHEGQRLLVFADAAHFIDPLDGGLREGLDTLASGFAATMLFTPQPVPGWGAAEQALSDSGVLVLPLQLGGLASGADWLSSQRALLMLEPDWPSTFPPRLQQHGLLWTTRADAPPDAEVDGLLFELQLYLGERRFQWLCGCATFPVPSWPVTLVLAPLFMRPGDDAVTGAVALASLPWFREGSWPQWLRQALMQRLAPDKVEAVAVELRRRLDAASLGQAPQAQAASLAEVALAPGLLSRLQQWRRAWWRRFSTDTGVRRAEGRLRRDVLFLGFIQRGIAQRLIQVVPEGLRRQVFREGLPLLGLRPWLPATLLLLALAGVAAQLPPLRDRVARAVGHETGPTLAEVARYASPTGAAATQVAFSPDGLWLAAGFADGRVVMLRRDGSLDAVLNDSPGGPVSQLHFSVNGEVLAWVRQKAGANPEVGVATRAGSRMDHDLGTGEVGVVMTTGNGEAGAQARPAQPLRTIPVQDGGSRWPAASQRPVLLAGFDGNSWLYTTADGGVRLQADSADPKRSRAVDIGELRAGTAPIAAMAVDRPRGRLAIAAGNRVLVLKDRGSSVEARFSDLKATVTFVSFRADGRMLLASLANGEASALTLGSEIGRDFGGEIGTPSRAEFVGDGSQIVQFGTGQVFVWSTAGDLPPSVTRVLTASQPVGALSPDGRQIAVVGTDGAVRLLGERREAVAGSHWQQRPAQAAEPAPAASAPARRVPAVLGMTQRAAVDALAAAGLKARVVLTPDPSMCAGVVIAQPPDVAGPAPVELSVADNKTAFYDLTCRGGGMQARPESGARPGFARVGFKMTAAGTAPAGDGLARGQCSWSDRGFRPGEPLDVEVDVPASRAQPLIKTLRDGGRYLVFKATNLGKLMRAGCVTSAEADPELRDGAVAQPTAAAPAELPASAPSSDTASAETGPDAELNAVRSYFGAKSDGAFNLQAARDIANRLGPAADTLALAMAIAKTESGDFRPRTEQQNASNTSGKSRVPFDLYEPGGSRARALGNTESGDGERYRGRGILMVVGRSNYRTYGSMADLGDRLVESPALLATDEPARAVLVAALRPLIRQLSRPIDDEGVRKIQRALNGRTDADQLLRNYREALPVAELILRGASKRSKS